MENDSNTLIKNENDNLSPSENESNNDHDRTQSLNPGGVSPYK